MRVDEDTYAVALEVRVGAEVYASGSRGASVLSTTVSSEPMRATREGRLVVYQVGVGLDLLDGENLAVPTEEGLPVLNGRRSRGGEEERKCGSYELEREHVLKRRVANL